ncbi:hypothetical protein BC938DRAFT_482710 [Jimgerdemannia flammicorona]|uniref:Uncharacterized protein n=1 Tax=Jimgerdemannia flammicorona TaxID=994334 RepID=A0A433QW53_9FUNG|nr:hypothetical protein BC938DRAFT_482710 [Jimgerdemannia flammicorona]
MAYSNAILAYPMEAYAKTKRILNISVSSTRKFEVPQLLNYLTAPNVVSTCLPKSIWISGTIAKRISSFIDDEKRYCAKVNLECSLRFYRAHGALRYRELAGKGQIRSYRFMESFNCLEHRASPKCGFLPYHDLSYRDRFMKHFKL